MIFDKFSLRLLLELLERVEEVSDKSSSVRENLRDSEYRTPEEHTLEEIVSDLGKAQDGIWSLISKFPEDVVREEIQKGGYFITIRKDEK